MRNSLLSSAGLLCALAPLAVGQGIGAPTELSGNVLWLDGADVNGDGVPGGGFAGGTTWVDRSSAGSADCSQSQAQRRPQVVSGALAGLSVVRFDGNDHMDAAAGSFSMLAGVEGATLFAVVSTQKSGSQRVLMIAANDSKKTRAGVNLFDGFGTSIAGSGDFGAAGRRLDSDPFQRIEGGSLALGEYRHYAALFDYAAGSLSLFAEGQLLTQATNFQSPGATSSSASANIRVGADANLAMLHGTFEGDVAELIVYDRLLGASERAAVEAYLGGKWFGQGPACGFSAYGAGLGGANLGSLSSGDTPSIGSTSTLQLTGFNGSGLGLLLLSLQASSLPLFGGTLLVDVSTIALQAPLLVSGGAGSSALAVPFAPGLVGLEVFLQAGVLDASQVAGVALSNGLSLTICP